MYIINNYFRLKSSLILKKGQVEGSFSSTDETPAAIAEAYETLFNQGRRNLVKDMRCDELKGKISACHMFKVVIGLILILFFLSSHWHKRYIVIFVIINNTDCL